MERRTSSIQQDMVSVRRRGKGGRGWFKGGGSSSFKFSDLLYRSDFFPGLGWMLTSDLWHELKPKWPPR